MGSYRFAQRAAKLGASVYDHAPSVIMLSVGSAYPPILPDQVLVTYGAKHATDLAMRVFGGCGHAGFS